MAVYVGKDVTVKVQAPVEEEIVSDKLIEVCRYMLVTQEQTGSHEAYHHSATSEPTPPFGSELTDDEYDQIEWSDDVRFSKSTSVNGEYAMMLFRFKCGFPEADVKKIVVKFEGYGTAPAGNGVTMKIWNHVSSAWSNAVSGTSGSDEVLTITITSNLGDYIDANGYIYVLARTTNPSDGTTEAVLYCDQAYGYVTRAKFTVDHTPISDRDMDGVADEPAHVTVKVNGSEVAVSSVNDSTGEVTLASGDFNLGDVITCTYRFDSAPYIAQEIRIEPKQRIEGLDGLGSDTVQAWAVLQKEIDGSIREAFKPGSIEQTSRFMRTVIYEPFNTADSWEVHYGTWTIENGYYKGNAGTASAKSLLKNFKVKNFEAEFRINHVGYLYDVALIFRHQDDENFYYFGVNQNDNKVFLKKRVAAFYSTVAEYHTTINADTFYKLKIIVKDDTFKCFFEDTLVFTAKDNSINKAGDIGFYIQNVYTQGKFDDLRIASPPNRKGEYGMIITWSQAGQTVKIGLDGVVFPEGSIPSPKNSPVFMVTPFKARQIKTIG